MRWHLLILAIHHLLSGEASFASEFTVSLKEKVQKSDVIAVGRVVKVRLGDIRKFPHSSRKAQDTFIHFRIEESLLGNAPREIVIETHSTSYREGSTPHGSTAGFSNDRVEVGKRFVAYLCKKEKMYFLTEESNQFLERIDDESNTVRDLGQTGRLVPLDQKLEGLRELAGEKINGSSDQQDSSKG